MKFRLSIIISFYILIANSQNAKLQNDNVDDIKKNMSSYNHYYSHPLDACLDDPLGKVKNYINTFFLEDYSLEIEESGLYSYPKKDIQLFYVENRVKKSFSHVQSDPIDYLLSKRILVGLNKKDNSIIYISGDIFKNYISYDFNLDEKKPETFYKFLELKLYNYWIRDIKFIEVNDKYFLFKAYSNIAKDDILIKVHRYVFDFLQVKTVKYNWTEQGSYKWINE